MSQGRNVRWWRELDSNQRAQESRFTVSRFQPLTHLSKVTLAPRARIERAIAALTVRCLTTWLSGKKLARVAGIEPATSGFVDRRSLIQLSYIRIDWCPRSCENPLCSRHASGMGAPRPGICEPGHSIRSYGRTANLDWCPRRRLERAAARLQGECSSN
jgi:hypothetical protein